LELAGEASFTDVDGSTLDATQLTHFLKGEAQRLGFALVGACPALTPPGIHHFYQWLDSGYDGQMSYLRERSAAYQHPSHVLPGVRSILMLGMDYRTGTVRPAGAGQARVSCYAWGRADYHDVIHDRLRVLLSVLRQNRPGCRARGVVDTAPLLEREFAQLAGLGWIGKNTLLINKRRGSWFFLAAVLTDVSLAYDNPHQPDHCGTCRACLDACPTQAFPAPHVLDATRCISYLTIESRDLPRPSQRTSLDGWLFGCDVCQEVCPWNHGIPARGEPVFAPLDTQNPVELARLFMLDEDQFRQRFRRTPLWRARRRGILRNAALLLGTRADPQSIAALASGLHDTEPLVRAAAAWALGRIASPRAARVLSTRRPCEADPLVRQEIEQALG
jgi:epoxyqueuosine reductase